MTTKPKFESHLIGGYDAAVGLDSWYKCNAIKAYKNRGEIIYWLMRSKYTTGEHTKSECKAIYAGMLEKLRAEDTNNEWEIRAAMHSRKLFNQWIKTQ